jgi:hypothetical protein
VAHPLSKDQSTEHRKDLLTRWAWDGGYWYPLKQKSFPYLIGLDAFLLERMLPEEKIRILLQELAPNEVLLFHEHILDSVTTIGEMPHLYGWSEAFLSPSSFEWVVYWSHEDTIAFGGEAIVKAIENAVPKWETALWP